MIFKRELARISFQYFFNIHTNIRFPSHTENDHSYQFPLFKEELPLKNSSQILFTDWNIFIFYLFVPLKLISKIKFALVSISNNFKILLICKQWTSRSMFLHNQDRSTVTLLSFDASESTVSFPIRTKRVKSTFI